MATTSTKSREILSEGSPGAFTPQVLGETEEPLTAYQIGMAAKAALKDFVCGKTSVHATREVTRLLVVTLKVREHMAVEEAEMLRGNLVQYYR